MNTYPKIIPVQEQNSLAALSSMPRNENHIELIQSPRSSSVVM